MTQQLTDDPDLTDAPSSSTGSTGPSGAAPAESQPHPRSGFKLLDLSLTQLLGGSMAAATAAALGSRLGVVGTIAGAAVLSVVSAIAAHVYTTSMARAKDAVVLVRSRRGADTLQMEVVRERWWRRADRTTTRRVLATTAAVFAVAAAFLTGLQLATGAQVTGTTLGGRASAGAVVDAPAAPRAEQVQRDSRATTSTGSAGSTPSPSATTPVSGPTTGAGAATAPASPQAATPTTTGASSPASPATPSGAGTVATPPGGATPVSPTPTAP
ncbi:hypothetical protein [Terrabacter sp. 2YAF2]|uniref:hypothetical protein n=1 Tax=Terrabacter sp. 2YAF2 TaxID=3233026 RepID=UPI003F9E3AE6